MSYWEFVVAITVSLFVLQIACHQIITILVESLIIEVALIISLSLSISLTQSVSLNRERDWRMGAHEHAWQISISNRRHFETKQKVYGTQLIARYLVLSSLPKNAHIKANKCWNDSLKPFFFLLFKVEKHHYTKIKIE